MESTSSSEHVVMSSESWGNTTRWKKVMGIKDGGENNQFLKRYLIPWLMLFMCVSVCVCVCVCVCVYVSLESYILILL